MAGQTINNNRFFIQFSYVAKIPMLIIKSMGMANTIINSAFTIFFISPPALNDNLQGFTPVIDESTGKITGYKTTLGGADTVFPFPDSLFDRATDEIFDSIYISSSASVYIPTYGAKFFQITSNPADNYINIRGGKSNLEKHLIPSIQNGVVTDVLSKNSNGVKLDISNYDFLILGYGVPSSNTTIRNVTVKWFYE